MNWFDKIEGEGSGGNPWRIRARVAYQSDTPQRAWGRWITGRGQTFEAAVHHALCQARDL